MLICEAAVNTTERRKRIIAEIVGRTGIDETMIERLVRSFYAKLRQDSLLAPVFEARIQDWEPHLQRMCAFWSSVADVRALSG
jgi:hemoglobin